MWNLNYFPDQIMTEQEESNEFDPKECGPSLPPATHQFFPEGSGGGGLDLRRAHWVGDEFCQTEPVAAMFRCGGEAVKKSRRGARSKSSQYRGVTFYRRTVIVGNKST